jgi:hypothetical protein
MTRNLWSRILIGAGLLGMVVGALDPIEGSLVILPSTGVTALGALLAHSRQRLHLCTAFAMVAVGVGALFGLSAFGINDIGWGANARSAWWGLLILPYPVGWMLGLLDGIPALVQSFRHGAAAATPV